MFFINNNYVDMMTRNSRVCTPTARLTLTNVMIGDLKCRIPLGLIFAVLTVTLQANQNITGLTLTTFGLGVFFFVTFQDWSVDGS